MYINFIHLQKRWGKRKWRVRMDRKKERKGEGMGRMEHIL